MARIKTKLDKEVEPVADAVKVFDVDKEEDPVIIERNDAAEFIVRNKKS